MKTDPAAESKVDAAGQMNAWFRWKNERDTPAEFAMQLSIAHPALNNPLPEMPEAATADVTPRRLQQFKVEPGASYAWQLTREGRSIASGKAERRRGWPVDDSQRDVGDGAERVVGEARREVGAVVAPHRRAILTRSHPPTRRGRYPAQVPARDVGHNRYPQITQMDAD